MYLNSDIYYDIASIDGSHNSYHRDDTQWRTSLATGSKPKREGVHLPLSEFSGYYNLGVACLSKSVIPKLPKVKKKYFRKYHTYEIDLESFPNDNINIVAELIEPDFTIPLSEAEKAAPPNAVSDTLKLRSPWLVITILGHENLLLAPTDTGFIVNHFNERFTANKKGQEYSSEQYSPAIFEENSKEI